MNIADLLKGNGGFKAPMNRGKGQRHAYDLSGGGKGAGPSFQEPADETETVDNPAEDSAEPQTQEYDDSDQALEYAKSELDGGNCDTVVIQKMGDKFSVECSMSADEQNSGMGEPPA